MKIKANAYSKTHYGDLCCGDTFTIREGGYYMVIDSSNKNSELYSVDLEDGTIISLRREETVFPVNGFFGIEDDENE